MGYPQMRCYVRVVRLHLELALLVHKRVYKLDFKLHSLDTSTLEYGVPKNAKFGAKVINLSELTGSDRQVERSAICSGQDPGQFDKWLFR